ncbi:hypothetical protein N665_0884s0003 [Sinapis alba]|nr:hypothetical protein N665_0884s0003 [Sinapis alba]
MAETLLYFGVQKLWDLLVRESDRFKGVDEQLNELKSDLNLLRSFLRDADAKKHASALMRNCVEEINEIVFDTEDIIETFLLKEELGKTSGIIKKHIRRLSCIVVDRKKIALEMESISKRISKVIRDMQSFGVQQMFVDRSHEYSHPLQERQKEMRHTFASNNESDFVGLEQHVKKLVDYLVKEDSSQVVSITGMGGIGKTTLAREVYNHETVQRHFSGFAWVCISQQFTREYVWQTILRKLMPGYKVLEMTEDELQEELVRVLETQKAVIVIDDIWREEDWDRIKPMFPREKGWKVILTSRNEGVALRADPKCFTFKPDFLTFEESWTLFQRIVFPKENNIFEDKVDDEMKELGKHMIKHCGGLPLAVKVLGGLLAAQYTLHDWKRIYKNIKSHIVGGTSFNDKNISSVYHMLYLSFEELPIYLKHCFLYLAHFPEDFSINVEKLSYYWAGEGIPRPRYYEAASIREVANGYIAELVKRNMVISQRDIRTSKFETCQLHDMMREVCLLKSEEENFLHIVHEKSTAKSEPPCKSRRLAVQQKLDKTRIQQVDIRYYMDWRVTNPRLRSLLFIKECQRETWMGSSLFFDRLQLMRVLDLSWAKFEGVKLPFNIGKLIHLRYLSLYQARVSHLPSSMKNLKQLMYLNLEVSMGSPLYVPNILKEMQKMKYLSFPEKMDGKVKLKLTNLVKLEMLRNFSTEHGSVRDLQGMSQLKFLSLYIKGEGCSMETLSSSLRELRHLENLYIDDYKVYVPTNDILNLRKPKLGIHIQRLPDEHHLPSHLTTIYLRECRLEEDPLPILEKLLQLKEVGLGSRSFCGKIMVCSEGGFPQLQKLEFDELYDWEEWIVEKDSMPLLHTLAILDCPKLKEFPDGVKYITSLKDLSIAFMGSEWKRRLSQGGEDYYKVQHISVTYEISFPR